MTKPIIFFSHSSSDKLTLKKLKEQFTLKTGNTIEIFLSSDGQSIPLGRNWVHKIHEALNEAKIMIVFLTPNSIKSNWLYFESGYAYSKDIRVIPVGFLGIDLNLLHPPLSLLQGFNITSEEGFNNIIAIINEEFDHKHELSFTNEEYNSIVNLSSLINYNTLGEATNFIESIQIELDKNKDFDEDQGKVYDDLAAILSKQIPDCQIGAGVINFYGVSIQKASSQSDMRFNIDPLLAKENFPIVENAIKNIRKNGVKELKVRFDFNNIIDRLKNIQKITARLYKSEVKFAQDEGFTFRNLNFNIDNLIYWGG
jgi:hypothetical protein